MDYIVKFQKSFVNENKHNHVGMQPSKTSQTSSQHHHNTFTPSVRLVPFGLVLVCVHRKVVKGNGLGSAHGCVVHVDCAWRE